MKGLIVVLMITCAPFVYAADKASSPKMKDFAYGIEINTPVGRALYQVSLPREVYRDTLRNNLGDVRVFNADKEAVPYTINHLEPQARPHPQRRTAALVAFYGKKGQTTEDVELRYRRTKNATTVEVINVDGANRPGQSQPLFYIATLDDLKRPINKIIFQWRTARSSFIEKIMVDVSNDLSHWRAVSVDTVIAQFGNGRAGSLTTGEIVVNEFKEKHVRIRFDSKSSYPSLHRATFLDKPARPLPKNLWMPLEVQRGDNGEYYFETVGNLPVERLRFKIPGGNNVMRVHVATRKNDKQPFRVRGSGVLHKLVVNGNTIQKNEVRVHRSSDRYYRLTVSQADSVLGTRLPEIEVGWVPDNIVFVARGPAPYTLTYGHRAARSAQHPIHQLIEIENSNEPLKPVQATLGAPRAIGGVAKLQPIIEVPWRTWILWSVLVLSVLLLSWMAIRLAKQLKKEGD